MKRVLIGILVGMSASASLAGELTPDQSAILTSSTMLFAAAKHCDDRYYIDEARIAMIGTIAGIDGEAAYVRNKVKEVSAQVEDTIIKVGEKAYCEFIYASIGGVDKGSLMLMR